MTRKTPATTKSTEQEPKMAAEDFRKLWIEAMHENARLARQVKILEVTRDALADALVREKIKAAEIPF